LVEPNELNVTAAKRITIMGLKRRIQLAPFDRNDESEGFVGEATDKRV